MVGGDVGWFARPQPTDENEPMGRGWKSGHSNCLGHVEGWSGWLWLASKEVMAESLRSSAALQTVRKFFSTAVAHSETAKVSGSCSKDLAATAFR